MRLRSTALLALALTVSAAARAAKPAAQPLIPLTDRERTVQLLSRFTFGPRPGEIERVEALGAGKWFEQQLNPAALDDSVLQKRLRDLPTLDMTAEQIVTTFPNYAMIEQVIEGKRPLPADPLLAGMYAVQAEKYRQRQQDKKAAAEPTEAEKEAARTAGQATAARVAGDLFALPKAARMKALLALPVAEQIAFTSFVGGDQKTLLLADFTPRERETIRGMAATINASGEAAQELAQAKILRIILSERQLQEVMTDFWFNHFNVFIGKDSDEWYTTPYERDVIRKHALGSFRDLLLATATSPAMMVYLDNFLSIGPNSIANGVDPANPKARKGTRGLNENYGREVMELHTVGVNGGYTQADVTHLAAILTGWGVDRPGQGGPFLFDPKRHEPGAKPWFGTTIPDTAPQDGMRQGIMALSALAARPETAHFISFLLAQRFVADQPPAPLVDRLAKTFLATDGDIKAILRALVASPEFNARPFFRNKVKTPVEFLASAFRSTATDPVNPQALVNTARNMGMPLFNALPPTGYSNTADHWMNTGALVDRLNFAYQLTGNKFYNQKFDAAHALALGLLAQPAISTASAPVYTEAVAKIARITRPEPPPPAASGTDAVLALLERTLLGAEVTPRTRALIHTQLQALPANPNPNAAANDTLVLMTGLIMGSPEFQLR